MKQLFTAKPWFVRFFLWVSKKNAHTVDDDDEAYKRWECKHGATPYSSGSPPMANKRTSSSITCTIFIIYCIYRLIKTGHEMYNPQPHLSWTRLSALVFPFFIFLFGTEHMWNCWIVNLPSPNKQEVKAFAVFSNLREHNTGEPAGRFERQLGSFVDSKN